MTTIAILDGDFEILFEDETVGAAAVAGMKMVRRASGASETTYTTNALYSAIADASDDFQAMGFQNPMLPVTPNAYTMENNYFIPRSSTEYLKEGAITANWSVGSGEGIYKKVYTTNTTAPDSADIGSQVTEGTTSETGTLLDYETLPNGDFVLWIRPDSASDTFATTNPITGENGLSVTGCSIAVDGTTVYSSIQVIGSVPTSTEVYLYQDRNKMSDWESNFQWWATDPSLSLGIIDILIRVKDAGVAVADGDVEVFSRRYTSLYDNFRLNVAAGGRSALPLASSPDINNPTGYKTAIWNTGTGSTMQVGDVLSNTTGGKTGGKYVVTVVTDDSGATGEFQYYEVGDLTPLADTDTFESSNRDAAINGAPTDTAGGPTDSTAGEGGALTITLGHIVVDHDGDANDEPYSIEIDAHGDTTGIPIAKVYERIKYVTRRGADEIDLFGAGINIPGESYRGLEAQAQTSSANASFTEGDDVTVIATGYTARAVSQNQTDTYVILTDQQTSIKFLADSDSLEDEGADAVVISGSPIQFTSPKSSPFGTFTGSQIFGARGVVYVNPHDDDTQSYILTDDNGVIRTPPNTVSFVVSNTLIGDRVLVARDTGTLGVIDKDQFGGMDTPATTYNGVGDLEIRAAGDVDTEVPSAGYIRVVENTLQEEHHYVYDSRITGTNGVFSLRDVNEGTGITTVGTADANGVATLIDTTATFDTNPKVLPGMLVRNTTATKLHHVWEVVSVTSDTELEVVWLYGPKDVNQDWDSSDTYLINALIGDHAAAPTDYATSDDMFDLILDYEAVGTTTSNSFVKSYASDFNVVVNVRQGKVILPFTQNTDVGDGGGSSTVVRTADTIAN